MTVPHGGRISRAPGWPGGLHVGECSKSLLGGPKSKATADFSSINRIKIGH